MCSVSKCILRRWNPKALKENCISPEAAARGTAQQRKTIGRSMQLVLRPKSSHPLQKPCPLKRSKNTVIIKWLNSLLMSCTFIEELLVGRHWFSRITGHEDVAEVRRWVPQMWEHAARACRPQQSGLTPLQGAVQISIWLKQDGMIAFVC